MPFSKNCGFLGSKNGCLWRIDNSYIHIVLPNLIHWEDIYSMGYKNFVWANKNSLCLEFFKKECLASYIVAFYWLKTRPIVSGIYFTTNCFQYFYNGRKGVPLYVLEDRLFRVANWEDQTKEDLASKFGKRGGKIANFSS